MLIRKRSKMLSLLIKYKSAIIPVTVGLAFIVLMQLQYHKGYKSCEINNAKVMAERTIQDHEKINKLRSDRVDGAYINKLRDGQF